MSKIREGFACVALAAAAFFLMAGGLLCLRAIKLSDQVDEHARLARLEVAAIHTSADHLAADVRKDLVAELAAARRDLAFLLSGFRADTRAIAGKVDVPLEKLAAAIDNYGSLPGQLQPVLAHAGAVARQVDEVAPMFLDCESNPNCVFNRYVGAARGVEQAAMNFGRASYDFREALPRAIGTVEDIGGNIKRTTDASARASESTSLLMTNLARASKPLPLWARLGLQIAPPAAHVAGSIVTTIAIKGRTGGIP